MTIETYELLSLISFILAGIFAIVAIVLFIRFNIPKVLGDLTGRTRRKEIESLNRQAKEGQAHLNHEVCHYLEGMSITERIKTDQSIAGHSPADETVVLSEETTVLSDFYILETIMFIHSEERIS